MCPIVCYTIRACQFQFEVRFFPMHARCCALFALASSAAAFSPTASTLALRKADVSMSAQSGAARFAAAGAALLLSVSPACAGDADAGNKIFNANCAACHAGGNSKQRNIHTHTHTAHTWTSVCSQMRWRSPRACHHQYIHI